MPGSRRSLLLFVPMLAIASAACAPAGAAIQIASPVPSPMVFIPTSATPTAEEPGTSPSPSPSPSEPARGNTTGRSPELSVSAAEPGYAVELTDPAAKAWKILITGTGDLSADRLELLVEVGDIEPAFEVRTIIDGQLVDATDLTGLVGDPTAATGGCHPTLQVCYGSGGMTLDPTDGRLTWLLERIEPGSFQVGGATAGWPGEPFILGPWRTTAVFQTG